MNKQTFLRNLIRTGLSIALIFLMNHTQIFAQMHTSNSLPSYPGGKKALKEFIDLNLKYPEEARKSGISGVVEVNFIVNKEGKVEYPKVIRGISNECDMEALRLVGLLSRWTPGMRQEKPVYTNVILPIEFKGEIKLHPAIITGKLTERNTGIPIEGAFIIIKGTDIGSTTSVDGSYKLEVPSKSNILECFGVGYSFKEVPVDYHSTINIELDKEDMIIDFNTPEN